MKIKLLVNWRREEGTHCVGDIIEDSKAVGQRLVDIGQALPASGKKEAAAVKPDTENAAEPGPEKR